MTLTGSAVATQDLGDFPFPPGELRASLWFLDDDGVVVQRGLTPIDLASGTAAATSSVALPPTTGRWRVIAADLGSDAAGAYLVTASLDGFTAQVGGAAVAVPNPTVPWTTQGGEQSSGEIWWGDDSLTGLTDDRLTDLRRGRVGFVFQSFGLVPVLSAAENVAVPLRIAGVDPTDRDDRVQRMLALVGLDDHVNQRPTELSGGQQQRVALARALVIEPQILIADEPTGQLDSNTAAEMMTLINSIVRERGIAAIISTHDPLIVAQAQSVIELHDGRVTGTRRAGGRHAAPAD